MLDIRHIPHLSLHQMLSSTKVLLVRVTRYPMGHDARRFLLVAEHPAPGVATVARPPDEVYREARLAPDQIVAPPGSVHNESRGADGHEVAASSTRFQYQSIYPRAMTIRGRV